MGSHHPVKFASFVALWLAAVVLSFSSAKLTKVLSCLWHDILVQLHLDPSQLLPCQLTLASPSEARESNADNGDRMLRAKPRKTRSGGGRGVSAHSTWRKRHVPPNVTSKNTIGFLSSAASAMAGAVQDNAAGLMRGQV